MSEIAFDAMGSRIRIVAEAPLSASAPGPDAALAHARAWTEDFARRLSRFIPSSELSRMNADPRPVVPASALLRAAVGAGLWAAERTGGLADPTLVGALEAIGYRESRTGVDATPLVEALACAPARRPARPHPDAQWRSVRVLDAEGSIARPAGVSLDTGGTGKGLAADALLARLAGMGRVAIDCGGDVRIGGPLAAERPFQVDVQHPLGGDVVMSLGVGSGGVATSGIDVNVWRRADGSFAHHLLDPSTGEPAWTGLVGATALAPTALEAETLAKAALLSGPDDARRMLAEHGGVLFAEDGTAEAVGALTRTHAVAA
jgi:FAD:protein FMN transferase